MKKHSLLPLFIIMAIVLLVSSSVAHPVDIQSCVTTKPAGFWLGLWHGIIAPFTFIISLFSDSVAMYAINNTGGWYDFGFVIGAGILFGGGKKAGKLGRRCRDEE